MIFKTGVAIVGGGCSGTLVAVQLLRQGYKGGIAIVEARRELGKGLAYCTGHDEHLLNVPAGKMSAFPDRSSDFLDWLHAHGASAAVPGTFAPRRLYGEYLADLLESECSRMPSGVECRQICGEAATIALENGAAKVVLADGDCIEAERIVLAIGNPASSPAVDAATTEVETLLHPSPWLGDALRLRFPTERVLLLGSGLTAVDCMLTLLGQGEGSQVTMVSRRGILPQRHTACLPAPAFAPPVGSASAAAVLREVRARIEGLREQGHCWRVALDGLRPVSNQIWSGLPTAERKRFLRHMKPYWEPHRHRMAPVIAERLQSYRSEGRLTVMAGRVRKLVRTGDSIQAEVSQSNGGELQLSADRVINCTGILENYGDSPRPLVRRLMADGLTCANELGIGFKTDGDGALLNAGGSPSTTLFTLGPPRRGELFETTAVPEIRVQAEALATRLIRGSW